VLIGPNNAGKSLTLREIESWNSGEDRERQVVESVGVDFPADFETAVGLLRPFVEAPSADQLTVDSQFDMQQPNFRSGESPRRYSIAGSSLQHALANTREDDQRLVRQIFSGWHTLRLDGRTRLELTDDQLGGDLLRPPTNHLLALAQDDAARNRVRSLTADAFGVYFVLDFLNTGSVRIRMSPRPPADADEELSLSVRAQAFHREATPIDEMSDGVKSFAGLVAAVESLPHRILLVDEPEAFLHPPLARLLGRALATLARGREGSLVVGTHSAEFLLGCVESGSDTAVVRLAYERGVATARELPAAEVRRIALDPLLRSTDVLSSLFHRGAVICESDGDRVVYDEMNRRLVEVGRGARDVLFLSTLGKDSVHRVVGPLRQLGVPAAAVVDLDMIQPGGSWHDLLIACGVPEARRWELETERARVREAFAGLPREEGSENPLKRAGIYALEGDDRQRAEAFLMELASYGVHLVPVGELESWLQGVGARGKKTDWVISLLGLIGKPGDDNYLRPGANDIWEFIDGIRDWVDNPARDGMSAGAG
jgi:hypothetical protein